MRDTMFAPVRLKLQTDYALRVLLFLGHAGRPASVTEIAGAFEISREHLVKVVQELVRRGWVATRPGRGGGVSLAVDLATLTVADVVAATEGKGRVLDCVLQPETCVLEPGCGLRRLLISAESAFFDVLAGKTLAELTRPRARSGGLAHLKID